MDYCVFSGWFCDEEPRHYNTRGSDEIRSKEFFDLWYQSVDRFTNPEKIFITDSASPIKPDLPEDDRIEFVSLNKNFGHAQNEVNICGVAKAMQSGLFYAELNEFDYAVYVEQDCLLYGENIVEKLISTFPDRDLIVSGRDEPSVPLKPEFVIMHRSTFMKYINYYLDFHPTDSETNPETKLLIISEFFNSAIIDLPFGQDRPIDYDKNHFFFQRASREELETYCEKTGFSWPDELAND